MKRIFNFNDLNKDSTLKEKACNNVYELNKNANYNSVQCIAAEVGTTNECGYYEALDDDEKDLNERCAFVKSLVQESAKNEKINKDPNCLKVFMLPEFFFRGKKGGYSLESSQELVSILRKAVDSPEYKDWIFVFGTTVAYSKNDKNMQNNDFEAYNYSFVQMGNGKEKDSLIVMKEHKSPVDFVQKSQCNEQVKLYEINTSYMGKIYNGKNRRNEEKHLNYDGNSIFKVGGLRIGLDICLDNYKKRLDRSISKESLDVHLITSGGLIGNSRLSNWKKGGILFHCDGLSSQIGATSEVNFNIKEKFLFKSIRPEFSKMFTHSPETKEPVENFTSSRKTFLHIYPSYKLPYKDIAKQSSDTIKTDKKNWDLLMP